MLRRNVQQPETPSHPLYPQASVSEVPHAADLYVGRQVAAVRIHSDVTQAELARAVQVSPQQLQKYEHGKNRISASMLL